MHKSLIWILIFLFIAGCRLLPRETITPVSLEKEDALNTPRALVTSTLEIINPQKLVSTILPTFTQTSSLLPELTATPITKPNATRLLFKLQNTSPVYGKNINYPDKGCNWLGVVGQVFDGDGNPIKNLVVIIKGNLGEKTINSAMLTGLKEAISYEPAGYEMVLSDKVLRSTKSLVIHIKDLDGNVLTPSIEFDTFDDCNKNLITINFQAIR
jgi:hypothetical protein